MYMCNAMSCLVAGAPDGEPAPPTGGEARSHLPHPAGAQCGALPARPLPLPRLRLRLLPVRTDRLLQGSVSRLHVLARLYVVRRETVPLSHFLLDPLEVSGAPIRSRARRTLTRRVVFISTSCDIVAAKITCIPVFLNIVIVCYCLYAISSG